MPRKPKEKPPDIGDIVYLRTDPDKHARLIVGVIQKFPSGVVKFKLAKGDTFSKHYEFELEKEVAPRTVIKGLTGK